MFRRKYYEQAHKCFDNSHDKDLKLRSLAYWRASHASELQSKIDSNLFAIKNDTTLNKKQM
jgi:hypothetical protein